MGKTRRELTDEWLVLACQDGDSAAFDRLVARWQKPLWRHARRVTGRDDLAWDALQEAWLAIVKGLGRLADPARFSAWAHAVVRHKSVDLVRADRGRREVLDEMRRRHEQPSTSGTDIEALTRAIQSLAPKHREVLALHYRDGFDIVEMGALLDVAPGTVKSRLHYARQQLKEKLA